MKLKSDLATFNSVFWFAGFLVVSFSTGLWELFGNLFQHTRSNAIRMSFILIGFPGFLILLIPAWVIDEKKYRTTEANPEKQKPLPRDP